MDANDVTVQLIREQITQSRDLSAKMAALAQALDGLTARISRLEDAMHTPPCRAVEALTTRVERVEQWQGRNDQDKKETRGRISNLAWSMISHVCIAALATLGTILVLGYKQWINQ